MLSDTNFMSLEYEPASEPLHLSVKQKKIEELQSKVERKNRYVLDRVQVRALPPPTKTGFFSESHKEDLIQRLEPAILGRRPRTRRCRPDKWLKLEPGLDSSGLNATC